MKRKLVKLAKCPICKKVFIKHGNQVYDQLACRKNQELIRKYGKLYYKQLCKLDTPIKPWLSAINHNHRVIKVYSDTEVKAAVKYNILSRFFRGDSGNTNKIFISKEEYRRIADELFFQLRYFFKICRSLFLQESGIILCLYM